MCKENYNKILQNLQLPSANTDLEYRSEKGFCFYLPLSAAITMITYSRVLSLFKLLAEHLFRI